MKRPYLFAIFIAVFVGLYGLFFVLDHSAWMQHQLFSQLEGIMKRSIDGAVDLELDYCSLLGQTVKLKRMKCVAHDTDLWSFDAENVTIGFSLIKLLLKKELALSFYIERVESSSRIENKSLAIMKPIEKLLKGISKELIISISAYTVEEFLDWLHN